jgi:hypothetical protein
VSRRNFNVSRLKAGCRQYCLHHKTSTGLLKSSELLKTTEFLKTTELPRTTEFLNITQLLGTTEFLVAIEVLKTSLGFVGQPIQAAAGFQPAIQGVR